MLKLSNRARSILAASISDTADTLVITSGHESRFPALTPGEWFPVVVVDASNNHEIMRCTARSGVNLTVNRAQEGTAARAFDAGAAVSVRLTAGAFDEATELPDRLKPTAPYVANADDLTENGPYRTDTNTIGRPKNEDGALYHTELSLGSAVQEWQQAGDATERRLRLRITGIWGEWIPLVIAQPALDLMYLRKSLGGTLEGPLITTAATTDAAGLRVTPGSAPDAEHVENGDMWVTETGIFARIAGATWALARRAANTFTGKQTFAASTAGAASLNIPQGVAPTGDDLVNGDVWATAQSLFARLGGATRRMIHNGDTLQSADWASGESTDVALLTPVQFHDAVRAAVAKIPYDGVGSTALLGRVPHGQVFRGEIYAGTQLRWAGTDGIGTGTVTGSSQWMATGNATAGNATTFRRVA